MLFSIYNKTGGMISQRANFLSLINGKTPITYLFHIWSLLLWNPEIMGCYLFSTSFTLVYFSMRKVTESLQIPYKFLTVKRFEPNHYIFLHSQNNFSQTKVNLLISINFPHSFVVSRVGIIIICLSIWSLLLWQTEFALLEFIFHKFHTSF